MTSDDPRVIGALWGVDDAALFGSQLRDALREQGVRRLQINVSDDAVGAAMRIGHYAEPIEAVVFCDGGAASNIVESLCTVASDVAAWEAEVRKPLDPDLPTEVRVDALSNVAFLRRPAELEYAQWRRRWLDEHTQVAIDTQSTFGYYQNVVVKPLTDNAIGVDAVVEELFPMAAIGDLHAFYGSGGDKALLQQRLAAMMASVGRMGADRDLDLVPTSRYDFPLGE